jgi:hypothetical protein
MQFLTDFSMYFQCISPNTLKIHTQKQCILKYNKKQCIINVLSMYYQCIDKKHPKISMYWQCIFNVFSRRIKKPNAGFFANNVLSMYF